MRSPASLPCGPDAAAGGRSPRGRARSRSLLGLLLALTLTSSTSKGADADIRRDLTVTVIEQVLPSVVNIATQELTDYSDPYEKLLRDFWGPYYRRRAPESAYSLGSGVIIDEEGYVLTNLHVVRRATKVWVKLADGREFEAQPIVGTTLADVALLKLVAKPGERFRAVRFARDDDLLLGETVLALGNPFGLGGSVSRGILSSKNRRPTIEGEALDVADWLQTDAAINPGSSGGPLVNLRGELIGLNVAIHPEGRGIGFAIPIRQVAEALSEIFIPEVTRSAWFGARIRSGPYPLRLTKVEPGSPAARAGLRAGDQIVQVNGKTPRHFVEATDWIADSPRLEVRLVVERDRERRDVTVRMTPLADVVRQKTGLAVQELTRELAAQFGYQMRSGLLISDVEEGSPAAATGLEAGSLLAGIDGVRTQDLLSAASAVADRKRGETAALSVVVRRQRGRYTQLTEGTVNVRLR